MRAALYGGRTLFDTLAFTAVNRYKCGDDLVHYIRELYSNSVIMLWHGNWSDHTGAARAA
jgi:hypothetical protein